MSLRLSGLVRFAAIRTATLGARWPCVSPRRCRIVSTLSKSERKFAVTREFSEKFAKDWVDCWNSHDLQRVLAHYTEGFKMSSPIIVKMMGEPSGSLKGKSTVANYWSIALKKIPNLRFELINVFSGANSVLIHYRNTATGSLAAECLVFDENGLVKEGIAHYL